MKIGNKTYFKRCNIKVYEKLINNICETRDVFIYNALEEKVSIPINTILCNSVHKNIYKSSDIFIEKLFKKKL